MNDKIDTLIKKYGGMKVKPNTVTYENNGTLVSTESMNKIADYTCT